ncbi:MAG: precorrin-8X methylmutase [Candidatus Hodgkinia cicadicola]
MLPICLRTLPAIKLLSPLQPTLSLHCSLLSPSTRAIAIRLCHSCGFDVFKFCSFTDGVFRILHEFLLNPSLIFSDTRALQSLLTSQSTKHLVICIADLLKVRSIASKVNCTLACIQIDILTLVESLIHPKGFLLVVGTSPTSALRILELTISQRFHPLVTILSPLGFVNGILSKTRFTHTKLHYCALRSCFGGLSLAAALINASTG